MSSEQVFIIAGKRSAVAPRSGAFASLTYYNLAAQVVIDVLKDAKMDKYYFLFIIWIIIFFIILFTLFFNIVESQTSMNILSKGLLFIFVLYVLYYILKNIYLYFNGYR